MHQIVTHIFAVTSLAIFWLKALRKLLPVMIAMLNDGLVDTVIIVSEALAKHGGATECDAMRVMLKSGKIKDLNALTAIDEAMREIKARVDEEERLRLKAEAKKKK
jgi:hypothetical protein